MVQDYEVGFGRPPKKNQFKPGQSGNPHGRRKNTQKAMEVVTSELFRPITAQENGRTITLPLIALAVRKLGVDAVKGNPRSIKLLFELTEAVGLLVQPAASQDNDQLAGWEKQGSEALSPEDQALVDGFRRSVTRGDHE